MNKQEYRINEPRLTLRMLFLILILFVSNFLSGDLFSPILVFAGILLIILSWGRIKISYLKIVKPLLGVFILGFIGMLGHNTRDIQRDIVYALSPISLIYIGYWIADNKRMWPGILKTIVFAGIIFSLIHITQFVLNPSLIDKRVDEIRNLVYNPGGSLIILSFVIGLFQNRIGQGNLFPKYTPRFIGLTLLFLSFILSFSRTGLIVTILLSFSVLGFFSRINLKSIISSGLVIFGIIFIVITTPPDQVSTFQGKIAKSAKELAVSDYQDMADISNNWRGYETYRAGITFVTGNLKQQIVGHGFGSLVDLGLTMTLGDVVYQKIPILHNGYAYILVKMGLLGILLYAIFYYRILKYARINNNSLNEEKILLSRLLLGLTISIMFTMIVVGGMAEIHDSEFVLLIGYLFRRIEQL